MVAVVDTNCDPSEVDYVIPGNDDALRAIRLLTSKISESIAEGAQLMTDKQVADMQAASDAAQAAADAAGEYVPEAAAVDAEELGVEEVLRTREPTRSRWPTKRPNCRRWRVKPFSGQWLESVVSDNPGLRSDPRGSLLENPGAGRFV